MISTFSLFKQKTAYDVRISDWSSDVCSSDLANLPAMATTSMTAPSPAGDLLRGWRHRRRLSQLDLALAAEVSQRHLSFVESGRAAPSQIGRASCRERVCQYV